jgi:hypothetical protein
MTINTLFLLGLAFYAGYSFKLRRTYFAMGLYIAFSGLCACLFYFSPIAYAAAAILSTAFMITLFMVAGNLENEKHDEDTKTWRLNTIITTLLFWPVNMFDLVYFSMQATKNPIK